MRNGAASEWYCAFMRQSSHMRISRTLSEPLNIEWLALELLDDPLDGRGDAEGLAALDAVRRLLLVQDGEAQRIVAEVEPRLVA